MSDSTRERILEAAGEVFARQGFEHATVREICASAHVNISAVNYYFRDKESLYIEAVRRAHQRVLANVPPAVWPPETPPQEQLRLFVRALCTRMLTSHKLGWPMQLMMRELIEPTIACQAIVEDFIRPQFETLLGVVDRLGGGRFAPEQRYRIAFSIVGQCMFYHVSAPIVRALVPEEWASEALDVERIADHVTRFSLAAIESLARAVRATVDGSAAACGVDEHGPACAGRQGGRPAQEGATQAAVPPRPEATATGPDEHPRRL